MAAGSEQEQDRTEPATPFKLREARKRGQVSKSLEINSLALLSTALGMSYFMGETFVTRQLALHEVIFHRAHRLQLNNHSVLSLFGDVLGALAGILMPFVVAIMIVAVLANAFQTGPVFSFFPLKPDMNRLNPAQGFKRLFSKKLLYESVKTVVKIVIFAAVISLAVSALLPGLMALAATDPHAYPRVLLDHGQALVYKLLLALLLIAVIDAMYNRWDFSRQMRMSRRELKEEVKRREGDPQIRARRRQLQREAVSRAGALRRVPEADVLITNPTHLSVALKYDRAAMGTPQIIAKGAGELARAMRVVANRHRVPVVENRSLARALFAKTGIGEKVPEKFFPVVAKILAWVFLQRERLFSPNEGLFPQDGEPFPQDRGPFPQDGEPFPQDRGPFPQDEGMFPQGGRLLAQGPGLSLERERPAGALRPNRRRGPTP